MKTTLNLNDEVLTAARALARQQRITLTRFVEDALRTRITSAREARPRFRLRLRTVTGTRPPRVDAADREALYELLDDGRD